MTFVLVLIVGNMFVSIPGVPAEFETRPACETYGVPVNDVFPLLEEHDIRGEIDVSCIPVPTHKPKGG